jgi:hypothetical protein
LKKARTTHRGTNRYKVLVQNGTDTGSVSDPDPRSTDRLNPDPGLKGVKIKKRSVKINVIGINMLIVTLFSLKFIIIFTIFLLLTYIQDPEPHSPKKLNLDPDPHKVNAEPKHWIQVRVFLTGI